MNMDISGGSRGEQYVQQANTGLQTKNSTRSSAWVLLSCPLTVLQRSEELQDPPQPGIPWQHCRLVVSASNKLHPFLLLLFLSNPKTDLIKQAGNLNLVLATESSVLKLFALFLFAHVGNPSVPQAHSFLLNAWAKIPPRHTLKNYTLGKFWAW